MPIFELEIDIDKLRKGNSDAVRVIKGLTDSVDKLDKEVKSTNKTLNDNAKSTDKVSKGAKKAEKENKQLAKSYENLQAGIAKAGVAMVALYGGINLVQKGLQAIQGQTQFLDLLERSNIAIASVVSSTNDIYDGYDKIVDPVKKFNAAQELSADILKKIQVMALETTATFADLADNTASVMAPAMAAGVDTQDIPEFVVAMTQAMNAMNIPIQQLRTESEAMLTGYINRSQDLVARNLGLKGEEIRMWAEQGILMDMIMQKLSAYQIAGERTAYTVSGLISNIKDAALNITSITGVDLFEDWKATLKEIQDLLADVGDDSLGAGKNIGNILNLISKYQGMFGDKMLEATKSIVGYIEELNEPENLAVIEERLDTLVESLSTVTDILSTTGGLIASVSADVIDGYSALPPVIREVGLLGAILGGKAGLAGYAGITILVDSFLDAVEQLELVNRGVINNAELFNPFSTDQDLIEGWQKLLDRPELSFNFKNKLSLLSVEEQIEEYKKLEQAVKPIYERLQKELPIPLVVTPNMMDKRSYDMWGKAFEEYFLENDYRYQDNSMYGQDNLSPIGTLTTQGFVAESNVGSGKVDPELSASVLDLLLNIEKLEKSAYEFDLTNMGVELNKLRQSFELDPQITEIEALAESIAMLKEAGGSDFDIQMSKLISKFEDLKHSVREEALQEKIAQVEWQASIAGLGEYEQSMLKAQRTFEQSMKDTPEQAELHNAVYDAEVEAIERVVEAREKEMQQFIKRAGMSERDAFIDELNAEIEAYEKATGNKADPAWKQAQVTAFDIEKEQEAFETQLDFYKDLYEWTGDYVGLKDLQNRALEEEISLLRARGVLNEEDLKRYEEMRKLELSRDGLDGLQRGMQKYFTDVTDWASNAEEAYTTMMDGMASATTDWLTGAETDFKAMALSWTEMLAEMVLQALAAEAMSSLMGLFSTSGVAPTASNTDLFAPTSTSVPNTSGVPSIFQSMPNSTPLAKSVPITQSINVDLTGSTLGNASIPDEVTAQFAKVAYDSAKLATRDVLLTEMRAGGSLSSGVR